MATVTPTAAITSITVVLTLAEAQLLTRSLRGEVLCQSRPVDQWLYNLVADLEAAAGK